MVWEKIVKGKLFTTQFVRNGFYFIATQFIFFKIFIIIDLLKWYRDKIVKWYRDKIVINLYFRKVNFNIILFKKWFRTNWVAINYKICHVWKR
jgi:hypothetical protein